MPNIISECCELVKLCHINCSGPVFEALCSIIVLSQEGEIKSADVNEDGTVLAVVSNDTYVLRPIIHTDDVANYSRELFARVYSS